MWNMLSWWMELDTVKGQSSHCFVKDIEGCYCFTWRIKCWGPNADVWRSSSRSWSASCCFGNNVYCKQRKQPHSYSNKSYITSAFFAGHKRAELARHWNIGATFWHFDKSAAHLQHLCSIADLDLVINSLQVVKRKSSKFRVISCSFIDR